MEEDCLNSEQETQAASCSNGKRHALGTLACSCVENRHGPCTEQRLRPLQHSSKRCPQHTEACSCSRNAACVWSSRMQLRAEFGLADGVGAVTESLAAQQEQLAVRRKRHGMALMCGWCGAVTETFAAQQKRLDARRKRRGMAVRVWRVVRAFQWATVLVIGNGGVAGHAQTMQHGYVRFPVGNGSGFDKGLKCQYLGCIPICSRQEGRMKCTLLPRGAGKFLKRWGLERVAGTAGGGTW
eukprot:1151943-Pelagomonas_calceolata.AAC.1